MTRALTRRQRERRFSDEQRCIIELLQHFHKLGYSLKDCADKRRLDREPRELLKYAKLAGCVFSDAIEISEQAYREGVK